MTRRNLLLNAALAVIVLAMTCSTAAYIYFAWQARQSARAGGTAKPPAIVDGATPVRLSAQARKYLGIISKPLQTTTYWRKIDVPGVITGRPGISDRGVVAPATGTVTQIHAYP